MNYYERHLGDYAKDAGHLSMLEHGAYSLLLDRYYTTDQPIPQEQAHRICRARTRDERAAVDTVLAEFFVLIDGAWTNGRADREITKMQAKVKAAQENGKRGGRPKRTKDEPSENPVGSDWVTQTKAHQSPDTSISSEAKASDADTASPASPPTPKDRVFAFGVPLLTASGVTDKNARSMLAGLCKRHGDEAVADAIDRCAQQQAIEPVSWLQAALKPSPGNSGPSTPRRERAPDIFEAGAV